MEVLLPEMDVADVRAWLCRVSNACANESLPVEFGVATSPLVGMNVQDLLRAAAVSNEEISRVKCGQTLFASPQAGSAAKSMSKVLEMVRRVAPSSLPVLILGETGVGKERIAEAIHRDSTRREKPMIRVNCAAFPEGLIEGELFGAERGAFTGADKPRQGLIERADGGTLFLDEIGELPLSLQPKLLRALQDKCIRRLGASKEKVVDFRLIAATNRDLESMAQASQFRQDLYFRLGVFSIAIPPLRERRDEIPALVLDTLRRVSQQVERPVPTVPPQLMRKLVAYKWPGNIRQLINLLERAMILSEGPELHDDAFPSEIIQAQPTRSLPPEDISVESERLRDSTAAHERRLLLEALRQNGGNQTLTAKALVMPRRTLIYKLRKHGIRRDEYCG
jgi:transcriptional regulator with PAS, ATPase and Fis domain